MRVFAAVQPPPAVLEHLENALAVVRGGAPASARPRSGSPTGLRWTAPEDRHITLAFFGEVPEGYLDDLTQGLDDVARQHDVFEAALRGAGLFDGRTLWVGCAGDGWPGLMADACALGTELLGRAEDRRSRPHLTVARARPARGRGAGPDALPGALAHTLALYTGPAWAVTELVLVRSQLGAGPGGHPVHDVVHRSALRAVAG